MPVGTVVLIVIALLIYFGLAQRVLDRMRLSDKTALGFVLAMILGSFIDIPLVSRPAELIVNVGGGLVPVGIALYLALTANEPRERSRSWIATIITAAAVYALGRTLPAGPEQRPFIIDPLYVYAVVAAIVGYIMGRSRRASFIAGTLGLVVADLAYFTQIAARGISGRAWVGGAGAFDSIVIAGFLAVILCEVFGEAREKLEAKPKRSD